MFARVCKSVFLVWFITLISDVNCEDICKDEYYLVPEINGIFDIRSFTPLKDVNEMCSKVTCVTKCCKPSEVLYNSTIRPGCVPFSKVRTYTDYKVDELTKFDYSEFTFSQKNANNEIIKTKFTVKDSDVKVRFNGKFYRYPANCTTGLNGPRGTGDSKEYFMLKGGTPEELKLTTENQNRWKTPSWDRNDFCFEYLVDDYDRKKLNVKILFMTYPKPPEHTSTLDEISFFKFRISACIISSFFLLLVLFVYGSLPHLRRLPGMVQMAYCGTYAIAAILTAALMIFQLQVDASSSQRKIYYNRLIYLTIVKYYLLLSTYFWMNILSFDIWWTFRGLYKQRQIHRQGEAAKFCWYAVYAWGIPLLITITAAVIDRSDLRKYNIIKPHFEDYFIDTMELQLYFNIPIGVLLFFNVFFFGLTAYSYWRIKRELTKFKESATSTGKFRLKMYLKLAVIMGVGWTFDVIDKYLPEWMGVIASVYNGFIGIAIFIVFVVKRNIFIKLCLRHSAVDVSSEANRENRWQTNDTGAHRLSTFTATGDRGNLLRSHAAKSAECHPGSPRTRRTPRESRRVSLAQQPGYVQLNQYRLLEPIGQGSYGIVKLAYNEEDDTHYAMKILSKRKLMRRAGLFGRAPPRKAGPGPPPDPLQRVYREIAVLKKLDHPNVVKLVEVLDDPAEDQLYLVFQLLEGGPVIDIPTDNPLSEDLARKYFRDALLGVEYLHYQRIAHRDIKPANLLLGEDRVQVADLGACGELAGAGRLAGAVGTPAFRAPEAVASPEKYKGEAADIWSLGVTLFAMVTGRVPWTAASSSDIQRKIQLDPLVFPNKPALSRQLKHLLARMLDKDPTTRATMQEIKENEWITAGGKDPLPSEQENCRLVEVTDEDMAQVVTSIPNLSTLILIKTMLKKHSFQNPFLRSREGSTARREPSTDSTNNEDKPTAGRRAVLSRAGRSLSAPGNYLTDRPASFDMGLESVEESRDPTSPDQPKDKVTPSADGARVSSTR